MIHWLSAGTAQLDIGKIHYRSSTSTVVKCCVIVAEGVSMARPERFGCRGLDVARAERVGVVGDEGLCVAEC